MLSCSKVLIRNLIVYSYTINVDNVPSTILDKLGPKLNLNLAAVKHFTDEKESSFEYESVISAKKGSTTSRESKHKKTSSATITLSLKRL